MPCICLQWTSRLRPGAASAVGYVSASISFARGLGRLTCCLSLRKCVPCQHVFAPSSIPCWLFKACTPALQPYGQVESEHYLVACLPANCFLAVHCMNVSCIIIGCLTVRSEAYRQAVVCLAALAHQADFDVCWCKGSVAELLFAPLVARIQSHGATIQGGRFVTDVITDARGTHVTGVKTKQRDGTEELLEADAVVFAVGINGAQASSATPAPEWGLLCNCGRSLGRSVRPLCPVLLLGVFCRILPAPPLFSALLACRLVHFYRL